MGCESENFPQMYLASLIKKNELALFSPSILTSLNWRVYLKVMIALESASTL